MQNTKHYHHDPSTQKPVNHRQYPQAVREILIHATETQHRDRQGLVYK